MSWEMMNRLADAAIEIPYVLSVKRYKPTYGGIWTMDVELEAGGMICVEWSEETGFGFDPPDSGSFYGERSKESYRTADEVLERIKEIATG